MIHQVKNRLREAAGAQRHTLFPTPFSARPRVTGRADSGAARTDSHTDGTPHPEGTRIRPSTRPPIRVAAGFLPGPLRGDRGSAHRQPKGAELPRSSLSGHTGSHKGHMPVNTRQHLSNGIPHRFLTGRSGFDDWRVSCENS